MKIRSIREMLRSRGLPCVLINNQLNVSWLTGGRGYISFVSEKACCSILITMERVCVVASNIEARRLEKEELRDLDAEYVVFPWYDEGRRLAALAKILPEGQAADDDDLANDFQELRSILNEFELQRYRELGKRTGQIVEKVAREMRVGCSEYQAWGQLSREALQDGIEPVTVLAAFDDRVFRYRHPIPTASRLQNYAMLVVGFRKWGLHASCTRFLSFDKISRELRDKFQAVADVDAAFIRQTRPGKLLGDLCKSAWQVYARTGYAEEWKNHHQGGLTGYIGREWRATEDTARTVRPHQAYAWNPSITGAKSEDTIIIGTDSNEIITHTGEYEYMSAVYEGKALPRPGVLIRNRWPAGSW